MFENNCSESRHPFFSNILLYKRFIDDILIVARAITEQLFDFLNYHNLYILSMWSVQTIQYSVLPKSLTDVKIMWLYLK